METGLHPTLVVIGNGMVSYKFCEKLVEHGGASQFHIVVFDEEDVPAYDRVHLTEFFNAPESERLLLAGENWYAENGIELRLGTPVEPTDRKRRVIHFYTPFAPLVLRANRHKPRRGDRCIAAGYQYLSNPSGVQVYQIYQRGTRN